MLVFPANQLTRSILETSCGPKPHITSEGSALLTTNHDLDQMPTVPKPKPRNARTTSDDQDLTATKTTPPHPETLETLETLEPEESITTEIDSYTDRKKFWESIATPASQDILDKKRMSMFEEHIHLPPASEKLSSKRASIHDFPSLPPVPKPRSTLAAVSIDEQKSEEQKTEKTTELPPDEPQEIVSEYMAAYKSPFQPERTTETHPKPQKSDSLDSEKEYISKYGILEAYENVGYQSDGQEDMFDTDAEIIDHSIPQIKQRQLSVSNPPVAASRKTIFERSISLPGEELQDISEQSVKARKRFFEQQIKNEMVIDQLMTQLDEEPVHEVKTLAQDVVSETQKTVSSAPELIYKESEPEVKLIKLEPKFSPTSSSSQDTKTEEDITPGSIKDVARCFPSAAKESGSDMVQVDQDISHGPETELFESSLTESSEDIKKAYNELDMEKETDLREDIEPKSEVKSTTESMEQDICQKQLSIESDQSISSERSLEMGSVGDAHQFMANGFQYKSDSMSKPSDSLEVHVDKSETEDSEKMTDNDQDFPSKSHSFEMKSYEFVEHTPDSGILEPKLSPEYEIERQGSSPINVPKEQIPDTVWEVVQSQHLPEINESVTDIVIDKPEIVEESYDSRDEFREGSFLDSDIPHDHSETSEHEHMTAETHNEVQKLILESLYHQKVHPEEAKKIAAELIDDIEMEIERRNLASEIESREYEPPVPHPEVAKNQISEYLRHLAESKGLDEREVELVESVLARKHSEISRLSRRDTQTSSMEITDEDLRYSGAECDLSPYESRENILEEHTDHESEKSDGFEKKDTFTEKSREEKFLDTQFEKDEEVYSEDTLTKHKSKVDDKIRLESEKLLERHTEEFKVDDKLTLEESESSLDKEKRTEDVKVFECTESKSDDSISKKSALAQIKETEEKSSLEKLNKSEIRTDSSDKKEIEQEQSAQSRRISEGSYDAESKTSEKIDDGFKDTHTSENIEVIQNVDQDVGKKTKHTEEVTISEDGSSLMTSVLSEETHTKTQSVSQRVDHKVQESVTTVTKVMTFGDDTPNLEATESETTEDQFSDLPITAEKIFTSTIMHDQLKQTLSDESKSSQDESVKSPEERSSSSSARKDDSDNVKSLDKPDVVFRKSKLRRDVDSGSSSGNLKTDRRSGADFETYSSSGESHYHSFEESAKSRPCSSDVEGLFAAGSSEYESALTSQDMSSRSHVTSGEYHTAVSSLSSRESMKSLDTESSGNMASIEVSEASETLVPSTFELDGDILDTSQVLEDEIADERFDQELNDFDLEKVKSSFETVSDSEIPGGSIDISEEDADKPTIDELTGRMKRSQEMTFQPEPKVIIADSPQSENALEMDERFGTSLEDGSVLSMSLSSASDIAAVRTVVELSRRDSDKRDSLTVSAESGHLSLDESELHQSSLDNLITANAPLDSKVSIDMSTSTSQAHGGNVESVTITTSTIEENGTQSVSTQVTSQHATEHQKDVSEPQKVSDNGANHEDFVEPKRVRGHRRNESTTFTPSMISGFASSRIGTMKNEHFTGIDKYGEMSPKEVQFDEMKDIDEAEKDADYDTEADQEYNKQKHKEDIDQEIETHYETECDFSTKAKEDEKVLIESTLEGFVDMQHELDEEALYQELSKEHEISEKDIKKSDKPMDAKSSSVLSEKSSFEEAEAEAAFSMVAHVSPAHKAKSICPILEDEDAEKHELETRERAQKDMEKRRAQLINDASPGFIPDITVTQHMTPLHDQGFHYPDLELEQKEEEELQKSAPETPASNSSKSSGDTDEGREYVLEDRVSVIKEEPQLEDDAKISDKKEETTEKKPADQPTETAASAVEMKGGVHQESAQASDSPNSDSFELLEQPDIIDDFVVIEEVAREAAETDPEGKSVQIKETKYIRKHDEEVEEYLVRSAPTPLTKMTDLKYYPDGNSGDDIGPFDFEDSPPTAAKKESERTEEQSYEYERDIEANKKWIEMQFQGDQASMIAAGYGYEMEFERGPLEDIKEEEATDFDPSSSRIGSLESQKHSGGSLGSVKDSFSSTPEYDVLAGRKFFTRSGEHDDVSMSSLQEFEHLERVISLENRRHHQGSQDSSSNGSFTRRFYASRGGQGDDISLSSLKEFEGLESACIAAHTVEVKAKEEEALLTHIEEGQENILSEAGEAKASSVKTGHEKEEDDYEKRMFEIDEIIKQAQSNVEKFIDLGEKEESLGRGDSLEEVAKVPDLDLDEPIAKKEATGWSKDDPMETSLDSLADHKPEHHESIDSLDMKKTEQDVMTASTDSIEFQALSKSGKTDNVMTDSIEIHDQDSKSCLINSDSLELTQGMQGNLTILSDSIDEDGSRIGEFIGHDQSSSSGRGDDFSSSGKEENPEYLQNQCAEFLIGSTDSLDPTSSTATHATYQYETDSVMSGSFTSGGSNTMVSSTDTIDPHGAKACGVDLAAAVRKVWFDDETFESNRHFTTELLDDGSRPFVTEVIEPCEDDPDYSHTIHRRVEMPPEIKKITFSGPDADQQLRQYVENFGEGEDVQESEEVDKDGNIHVKRVVQKRFIIKSDGDGTEKRLSGEELESYLQKLSAMQGDFDLKYKDSTSSSHQQFDASKQSQDYQQTSTSDVIFRQGRK